MTKIINLIRGIVSLLIAIPTIETGIRNLIRFIQDELYKQELKKLEKDKEEAIKKAHENDDTSGLEKLLGKRDE